MHRVSHYLLSSSPGCLGSDFRVWAAGSHMSQRLRSEITAYQLCMLDDSMVEGPHARIGRVTRGASCSGPAWWSGVIRSAQNARARELSSTVSPNIFEVFFRKWKLLAQLDERCYRACKMRRVLTSTFLNFVYRSGPHNIMDWSALCDKTATPKSHEDGKRAKASDIRRIQRDYVLCSLKPGKFYSMPMHRPAVDSVDQLTTGQSVPVAGVGQRASFQVVTTSLFSKKFVASDSLLSYKSMEVPGVVQYLSSRHPSDDSSDSPMNVFEDGMPEVVDLMRMASWKTLSTRVHQMSTTHDSAHAGCFRLHFDGLLSAGQW